MEVNKLSWEEIRALSYMHEHSFVIKSDISRVNQITYNHVVAMIKVFHARKWITNKQNDGRSRVITLTAIGEVVAVKCFELVESLTQAESLLQMKYKAKHEKKTG